MTEATLKRSESRKRFGPGVTPEEIARGFGSALKGDIVLARDMPNSDKVGGAAYSILVINTIEGFYRTANVYLSDGPLGGHFGRNYKAAGSYVVPLPDTQAKRDELYKKLKDRKATKGKPYASTKRTFNGLVEKISATKAAPAKATVTA